MTNDCLFIKLKAEVNNDSLVELGSVKVPVNTNGSSLAYFQIKQANSTTFNIKTKDGLLFNDGTTSATVSGTTVQKSFKSNTSGLFVIDKKYDIEKFDFEDCAVDVSDLSYMSSLTDFMCKTNDYTIRPLASLIKTSPVLNYLYYAPYNITRACNDSIKDLVELNPILTKVVFNNWSFDEDISLLTTLHYFSNENGTILRWTARPSNCQILAGIFRLGDAVDAMLLNQAQCVPSSELPSSLMVLSAHGNCSFSSEVNAAIANIKSKGYTVRINGQVQ